MVSRRTRDGAANAEGIWSDAKTGFFLGPRLRLELFKNGMEPIFEMTARSVHTVATISP